MIHPAAARLVEKGPGSWRERADWMLLKNERAFPRACNRRDLERFSAMQPMYSTEP